MTDQQSVVTVPSDPFRGGARFYLNVPPVPVAKGGVLSVATVIPTTGHALMGAEYETDACSRAHTWTEFCTQPSQVCPTYVPSTTGQKEFDGGPEVITGNPYAVYAGVECDLMKLDDAEARARRRLAYGERAAVDDMMRLFIELSNPFNAYSEGPLPLATAIGLLEEHAATVYGGEAIILLPISLYTRACAAQIIHDGRTCQGSLVAGLAGTAAGVGTLPIYVTGRIVLLQGPVESYIAPPMIGCDRDFPPRALAERIYVPLVECFMATVDVCQEYCPAP